MNTDNSIEDDSASVCANCGKEGNSGNMNNMNTCNKCNQAKYCNAACKKKHRSKHKKQCERYLAELHDEKLFKKPPLLHKDCPICFERMPSYSTGGRYMSCCGQLICSGCIHAPVYDDQGNEVAKKTCPFCRVPPPSSEKEAIKRMLERVEVGDSIAIANLGSYYRDGTNGYPQDYPKALELWHRAAELGHAVSYRDIAYLYGNGLGVEKDKKKAVHYIELAAMKGYAASRHNLGFMEENAGNIDRALKHFMIAIRDGYADSLNGIKQMYSKGQVTKDDYADALQSYQVYLSEIKSVQRDKAAATYEHCRYY